MGFREGKKRVTDRAMQPVEKQMENSNNHPNTKSFPKTRLNDCPDYKHL